MKSKEMDLLIIELVRTHPQLYDIRNKDYHNQNAKSKIWEYISQVTGLKKNVANNRWRYFRKLYKNSYAKCGADLDTDFPYKEHMNFLATYYMESTPENFNYAETNPSLLEQFSGLVKQEAPDDETSNSMEQEDERNDAIEMNSSPPSSFSGPSTSLVPVTTTKIPTTMAQIPGLMTLLAQQSPTTVEIQRHNGNSSGNYANHSISATTERKRKTMSYFDDDEAELFGKRIALFYRDLIKKNRKEARKFSIDIEKVMLEYE